MPVAAARHEPVHEVVARRDAAEHGRDAPRIAVDREGAPVAGRAGGLARGRQRRPPSHGGNRVCAKPSAAMTLPTTWSTASCSVCGRE